MLHISAADIGGTHSRFAHFSLSQSSDATGASALGALDSGASLRLHSVVHCPTADLRHTEDAFAKAATTGLDPRAAQAVVWAVAGPVSRPLRARPTNADVDIDLTSLMVEETGGRIAHCVNDFIVQAWATLTLPGLEAVEILPRVLDAGADSIAVADGGICGVLGAGTGLGTASIIPLGDGRYQALAAEGGHTAFPWRGRKEEAFGEFLCAALDIPYACGDQVLSGRGLALLHHFLTGKDWPVERVAAEGLGPDSTTLRTFARFYGRQCRHWVLQTLCTGGLYLTGGVAVKNPRIVRSSSFTDEFYNAPANMLPLLQSTPVRLMTREHAGLWGAARLAQEVLSFS